MTATKRGPRKVRNGTRLLAGLVVALLLSSCFWNQTVLGPSEQCVLPCPSAAAKGAIQGAVEMMRPVPQFGTRDE